MNTTEIEVFTVQKNDSIFQDMVPGLDGEGILTKTAIKEACERIMFPQVSYGPDVFGYMPAFTKDLRLGLLSLVHLLQVAEDRITELERAKRG